MISRAPLASAWLHTRTSKKLLVGSSGTLKGRTKPNPAACSQRRASPVCKPMGPNPSPPGCDTECMKEVCAKACAPDKCPDDVVVYRTVARAKPDVVYVAAVQAVSAAGVRGLPAYLTSDVISELLDQFRFAEVLCGVLARMGTSFDFNLQTTSSVCSSSSSSSTRN